MCVVMVWRQLSALQLECVGCSFWKHMAGVPDWCYSVEAESERRHRLTHVPRKRLGPCSHPSLSAQLRAMRSPECSVQRMWLVSLWRVEGRGRGSRYGIFDCGATARGQWSTCKWGRAKTKRLTLIDRDHGQFLGVKFGLLACEV